MDFIDRVFIINLDNRIDRMFQMAKLIDKLEITNWERFSAIKPDIEEYRYGQYNRLLKYVKGSIGCKLSHLEVLKIVKEKFYKKS